MTQSAGASSGAKRKNDVYLTSAHEMSFSGWEPKRLFRQLADGHFEECAYIEGFDSRTDGRSLVAEDLDGDGDQELLMLNRSEPLLQLFRNDGAGGKAIELDLQATHGNREAMGAQVRVSVAGQERVFPVLLQRGYASSMSPRVHVGMGTAAAAQVKVRWRPGVEEDFGALASGARYALVEGSGKAGEGVAFRAQPPPVPERAFPSTLAQLGLKSDGRPTLVQVFASWCKPCAAEVPALNAVAARLRVVGLGAHPAEELPKVVATLGITYPVQALTETQMGALSARGVLAVPMTLAFDGEGKLLRVVRGKDTLEGVLRELKL